MMRAAGLVLGLAASWACSGAAEAQLRPQIRPAALVQPAPEVSSDAPVAGSPPAVTSEEPRVGPETGLPLPRFVSLKTREGNARRGPGMDHRIDWVFVREDMPLLITAEYGHWRRVEDRDGHGGWVHYALLSGVRTVIVDAPLASLRSRPEERAPETALVEAGVVARLEICQRDWCRINARGHRGWTPKAAIWGVGADEILD
ncbi:SH3 domain-containing protein [Rubellimicrobium sp. CFH 75288]|uniref:SH3 domain-containing protein n=1 Tax=Rubellimicrobium sp. CFH 75288 TaxID=2697034 RepID=UPI00352ADEC3